MDTNLKSLLSATAADPGPLNRLVQYIATADNPVQEARDIVAAAKAIADAEYAAGVQQAQEAEARRTRSRSVSELLAGIPMDSGTAAELRAAIEAEKAPAPPPEPVPA